jgi:hypothetical protein
MARSDRSGDNAPASKSQRRRRRPPVLELKATEVGGETASGRARKPKPGAPRESGSNPWAALRARLAALEWHAIVSPWLIAGGIGTLAGAGVVLLVVYLMDRGGDRRLTSLVNEVASLSTRIETLATGPRGGGESNALGERIDRLTAAIGAAEQRLATVENRPTPQSPDPTSVDSRTAAIEATLKDLRTALADLRRVAEQTPPAGVPATDALSGRIGTLEDRIASLAASNRANAGPAFAAEIAALHALGDALNSGKPFAKELDAVRALLGERAASLVALDQTAAQGLPAIATLAHRFSELAPILVRGPDPDGGFLTRLVSNAVRLVEVRPVGEPMGTSMGAVVARMETKLDRGDLSGALDEAASLPQSAKITAADWLTAATGRRDAEIAVKNLIAAALANPAAERTRP